VVQSSFSPGIGEHGAFSTEVESCGLPAARSISAKQQSFLAGLSFYASTYQFRMHTEETIREDIRVKRRE
jgi:hypothetical protein